MALSQNIFDQFLKQSATGSGQFGSMGQQDIGQAGQYFRTLLGPNRQAALQAASPAISAELAQSDAAKREQNIRGTNRTGGTAALNQQEQDIARQHIDNLLGQLQSGAAQSLAGTAGTELQTMTSLLGTGIGAAQKDIEQRNMAKAAIIAALIGGGGNVAGAMLGRKS